MYKDNLCPGFFNSVYNSALNLMTQLHAAYRQCPSVNYTPGIFHVYSTKTKNIDNRVFLMGLPGDKWSGLAQRESGFDIAKTK